MLKMEVRENNANKRISKVCRQKLQYIMKLFRESYNIMKLCCESLSVFTHACVIYKKK